MQTKSFPVLLLTTCCLYFFITINTANDHFIFSLETDEKLDAITRACTSTPLSVAAYINLYGVPVDYLGNIAIINFESKNLSSLDGIQNVSIIDVVYLSFTNNCIVGSMLDPMFPSSPFQNFPNLSSLFLDENLIESLPSDFLTGLTTLSYLNMNYNSLSDIPEGFFSSIDELTILGLAHNQFTTFSSIDFMSIPLLQAIFLNDNIVINLPANIFANNLDLRYIYLNNNGLTVWPPSLLNSLIEIVQVNLSYNSLTDFAPEYLRDGSEILLIGNPLTITQQEAIQAAWPEVNFAF